MIEAYRVRAFRGVLITQCSNASSVLNEWVFAVSSVFTLSKDAQQKAHHEAESRRASVLSMLQDFAMLFLKVSTR